MDKFHEQLLRTKKSPLYKILSIYMYISIALTVMTMALAVLSLNIKVIIVTVIFLASVFIVRFLRDKQYREFEYIFTNGNLQIDIIYNMKKRKTLFDTDIKDIDDFGISKDIKPGPGVKVTSCVPWDTKGEKYTLILNSNGKHAVEIAPNEELLKLINLYNVRRPRF